MAFDRREALHAVRPQPLGEAVDQLGAAFLAALARCVAADQIRLLFIHPFCRRDGEPDRLEAEAGIERLGKELAAALELERDEARHVGGAAGRPGEGDLDRLRAAVDPIERKPQGARADAVARERMDDVAHQALRDRDHGLLGGDRLHEIAQAVIDGRRQNERERFSRAAERLIDPPQQFALEARREGRARIVDERAGAAETEAAQGRACRG